MQRKLPFVLLICFFCLFGIGTAVCAENQGAELKVWPDAVYPEGIIPERSESVCYQSVSDALSVAESGDSIILMDDIEQSSELNNGYGIKITLEEITLDLNGKTYQDKINVLSVFQVEANAKLIIKDNQETGKITASKAKNCIKIEKDGYLSVFSGTIKNTRTSGIGIENEGVLMMYGGSISAREYGIVCIGDPESTENKTEIYDGTVAVTLKHAFHVNSGTLSIFGGRFKSIKKPCFVIDDESSSNVCIRGGIYNMDVSDVCGQSDSICEENGDQTTASAYPWKVVPANTICVTALCGNVDDGDNINIIEDFGHVLGEGTYCKGDNIVLTAPVKQGWQFSQWYKKENEEWTALEQERESICVLSPDENVLVAAGYIEESASSLNIHVQGNDYTISGTLNQDGHYDGNRDFECDYGAVITLKAGDIGDFQYWINESGKITDQSGTYTFTAVQQDTTIKEKMLTNYEESTAIQFLSSHHQILKESTADGSSEISFPSFQPCTAGKIFKTWIFADNQEAATNEKIIERVRSGSEQSISIIPVEDAADETCDVVLVYPSATDNSTYAGQKIGKSLEIVPDSGQCPQGKNFAYWTDDDHNILGFSENYQMRAVSEKTLTAKFLSEQEETAVIPVLAWMDCSVEEKESETVIHLTAVRSLSEEDEILDQGILYSDSNGQALMITTENVSKLVSTDLTNNGSFTGHFHYNRDECASGDDLYCRAYAVIRHQSELYVLYTETKKIPLL